MATWKFQDGSTLGAQCLPWTMQTALTQIGFPSQSPKLLLNLLHRTHTTSVYVQASICQVAYRWLPSEWNGANLPFARPSSAAVAATSRLGARGADPQSRHGRCGYLPSGRSDTSGLSRQQRCTRQSRPSVFGPTGNLHGNEGDPPRRAGVSTLALSQPREGKVSPPMVGGGFC